MSVIFDGLSVIGYLLFVLLSSLISIASMLNQKRIRKRFKIDSMILFMILYLSNFFITYTFFEALNIYVRVGIPLIILFFAIYLSNRVQIIGLTGGIACGKSAVSTYLRDSLRLSIIDCDVLARKVVEVNKPAYRQLKSAYGEGILQSNGEIDRQKLGKLVFNDPKVRRNVTSITGKQIFLEILREVYDIAFRKKENIMVLDAPILFETKYLEYFCFPIMVVYVSQQSIQVERLQARDSITEEEAMAKIKSQMPLAQKIAKADILLCNDGNKEKLHDTINKRIHELVL